MPDEFAAVDVQRMVDQSVVVFMIVVAIPGYGGCTQKFRG
jgi:hypothetical protein